MFRYKRKHKIKKCQSKMFSFSVNVFVLISLFFGALASDVPKKDTPTEFMIHATNKTEVPSVRYIVDAVETLKEAYAVYSEDDKKAQVYAELFQEKHNETQWNVVVGYTATYIKSKWYIETSVTTSGGKTKDSKKDKDEPATLYLIFSNN